MQEAINLCEGADGGAGVSMLVDKHRRGDAGISSAVKSKMKRLDKCRPGEAWDVLEVVCYARGCKAHAAVYRIDGGDVTNERAVELVGSAGWVAGDGDAAYCAAHAHLAGTAR